MQRDPQAVLRDVQLERYTIEQARDLFGVQLTGSPLCVDVAGTAQLRAWSDGL